MKTEHWVWNDQAYGGDASFQISTNRAITSGEEELWDTVNGTNSYDITNDVSDWFYDGGVYTGQGDVGFGEDGWQADVPQELGTLTASATWVDWIGSVATWSDSKAGETAGWVLHTGGKQLPGKQSLFAVTAPATEEVASGADIVDGTAVAYTKITVDGTPLGTDGIAWKVYPDGADVPLRVQTTVPLVRISPAAKKYQFTITASTNGTAVDLSTVTPEFCVGQQVTFAATWDSDPGALSMTGFWHLPDKYVNEVYPAFGLFSPATTVYDINSSLLENTNQTTCWFVNGSGGACSIRETLHFTNGQYVNIATAGSFTVYRPTFTNFNNVFNYFTWNNPTLQANMEWNVTLVSKYDGLFGVTQIINANGGIYDNGGFDCLDGNTEIYGDISGNGPQPYVVTNSTPGAHTTTLLDNPDTQVIFPPCPDMLANFKDYLRFKPGLSTNDGNIFVTISTNGWHMDGQACVTGVDHTNLPPAITPINNDTFPVWYGVRSGGGN